MQIDRQTLICKEALLDKGINSYHPGASLHSPISSAAHHIYEKSTKPKKKYRDGH
jgi:hypothetical protein